MGKALCYCTVLAVLCCAATIVLVVVIEVVVQRPTTTTEDRLMDETLWAFAFRIRNALIPYHTCSYRWICGRHSITAISIPFFFFFFLFLLSLFLSFARTRIFLPPLLRRVLIPRLLFYFDSQCIRRLARRASRSIFNSRSIVKAAAAAAARAAAFGRRAARTEE